MDVQIVYNVVPHSYPDSDNKMYGKPNDECEWVEMLLYKTFLSLDHLTTLSSKSSKYGGNLTTLSSN